MDCNIMASLVMANGVISLAILYFICSGGQKHGF